MYESYGEKKWEWNVDYEEILTYENLSHLPSNPKHL
jgi:hypothetical protein